MRLPVSVQVLQKGLAASLLVLPGGPWGVPIRKLEEQFSFFLTRAFRLTVTFTAVGALEPRR
jgi:hypothetical protein